MDRRVAAVDAVDGVEHGGLDDGRYARDHERTGTRCQRGPKQRLVPVNDFVRVGRGPGQPHKDTRQADPCDAGTLGFHDLSSLLTRPRRRPRLSYYRCSCLDHRVFLLGDRGGNPGEKLAAGGLEGQVGPDDSLTTGRRVPAHKSTGSTRISLRLRDEREALTGRSHACQVCRGYR